MVACNLGSNTMATAIDEALPVTVKNSGGRGVQRWDDAPHPFNIPKSGWPTEAPPGTVEKLLVMIAREARGEKLFHPYDAKNEVDLSPLFFYLLAYERQEQIKTEQQRPKENEEEDINE